RYDHHRNVGVVLAGALQDVDPVQLAVLEPDVQDDQVGRRCLDRCERAVGIPGQPDVVPFVPQDVSDQIANVALVVHHKNIAHGYPVFSFLASSAAPDSCASGTSGRTMTASAPQWPGRSPSNVG